ncbi:MAG: RsmB/NOP family class I SAM-dependent RNA methyltransferase [Planctomycetota bacterium]
MTDVWQHTVEVTKAWLSQARSPRDTIADNPVLRGESSGVRASVVRAAQAVVGSQRRLEYVLGGAAGLGHLPLRARALALVLAHAVEREAMLPADAESLCATAASCRIDFGGVRLVEQRLAVIADDAQRFAVRHSMPDWLGAQLLSQFRGEAAAVARSLGSAAPRTLRTNTLRIATRTELAAALLARGVPTRAAVHAPLGLHVEGDADLFALDLYRQGAFEQQDEASQLAALVVAPPPGGRVLDLCAGSGGKTLALAAALRDRGEILATDVHAGRLEALRMRVRRAGVGNVRSLSVSEHSLGDVVGAFADRADRILVDAPCSGTGSWRRRPEARWSLTPERLESLVAAQDRVLDRAASVLRPGARLVYATCSLLEVENQGRAVALQARWPHLELVRIAEILGGDVARPIADVTGTFLVLRPDRHGCDGFFAAVLRRRRTD